MGATRTWWCCTATTGTSRRLCCSGSRRRARPSLCARCSPGSTTPPRWQCTSRYACHDSRTGPLNIHSPPQERCPNTLLLRNLQVSASMGVLVWCFGDLVRALGFAGKGTGDRHHVGIPHSAVPAAGERHSERRSQGPPDWTALPCHLPQCCRPRGAAELNQYLAWPVCSATILGMFLAAWVVFKSSLLARCVFAAKLLR